MLETVDAERFYGDAEGGATVPAKMACVDRVNNKQMDVFVKCSSQQCPPSGLAREVIGCLLAIELGIPVGKPLLVTLNTDLVDQIKFVSPSTSERMKSSVVPAFGSVALGDGFTLCRPPFPTDFSMSQSAVEIWAFDQLILNPDRNGYKPNCMTDGESIAVIDHEKALEVTGVGGFLLPAPWEDRWSPSAHLFDEHVRSGSHSLERLRVAWESINKSRVDEIASAVPSGWTANSAINEIQLYLYDLHRNVDLAFNNLERISS